MELEAIAQNYVLPGGAILLFIGGLWLIIAAFRAKIWWGLLSLIPPLFLIFVAFRWRRARFPFGVMLLGLLAMATSVGLVFYSAGQLKEWEKIEKEEVYGKEIEGRHLTLTGWNKKNYTTLWTKWDTVVLQMANPDVTDETLVYVLPMAGLYELDLNDTQITDRGLAILKTMPQLRRLHLRGTHITDAGFRENLLPMDSLMQVDVRETPVAKETLTEWRKAKKGRQGRS
jgi:hypothetical protein